MHVTKDFASGILFILFGLGSALIASDYEFGTPVRMGPGFFPILVGGLIVLLGLAVLVVSLISPKESETIATINARPIFFVSLAIAAFGLLIERAGLAAALFALVLISSFASKERRLGELALIYVTVAVVVWVIFLKLLEVRIAMVAW